MGKDSLVQIPRLIFNRKIDNSLELIKQLKNGCLIYYKDKTIYIYDKFNKYIRKIKEMDLSLICELKNDKILIITKDMDDYIINIFGKEKDWEKGSIKSFIKLTLILEIDKNNYIMSCLENTFYYYGDNITKSTKEISKECYSQGTIIDKRILVLFNNEHLHIYEMEKYEIIYEIDNLPLINNKSLSVIQLENNKIVLLGCKELSINGILTIKINLDNKDNYIINHKYNYKDLDKTDVFFCPLKNFKDSNRILDVNHNDCIYDSNYILVFGDKIKVCKIVEEGNRHDSTIEIKFVCYIGIKEDIKEHFKDITSVIQLYGNSYIMINTKSGQKEFSLIIEKYLLMKKISKAKTIYSKKYVNNE